LQSINDIVCVADVQKSSWGFAYYLNYGIWVQEIGEYPLCPPHQCPITFRIGDIPDLKSEYNATYEYGKTFFDIFFNMERFFTPVEDYAIDLQERMKVVHHVFQDLLPTFFNKLSMDFLREECNNYEHVKYWVKSPAQKFFPAQYPQKKIIE